MDLVWRCTCGEEFSKADMRRLSHVAEGRKRGEEHKIIGLVDKETGEVKATNLKQAVQLGFVPRSTKKRKGEKQIPDEAKTTTIPAKFISRSIDLDARLLILYDIAIAKFGPLGYDATEGEFIWDCITKYFAEHAEDFGLEEVLVGMLQEGVKV